MMSCPKGHWGVKRRCWSTKKNLWNGRKASDFPWRATEAHCFSHFVLTKATTSWHFLKCFVLVSPTFWSRRNSGMWIYWRTDLIFWKLLRGDGKKTHSNLASDLVELWTCSRRGSSVFRFSSGPSSSSLVAPAVVLTTGLGCMGISSDTVHLPGQDSETLYQRSSLTMATLSRTCNLAFFSFLSFFSFLELDRFLHTHAYNFLQH